MKKLIKDLTLAVETPSRGTAIADVHSKLTETESIEIKEALQHVIPYREAEMYRPFNFWLPLIDQCVLSNRSYKEEELFLRKLLPKAIKMLNSIRGEAKDLHPECLRLYGDVLDILRELSDEINNSVNNTKTGVWFALKVSENATKTNLEIAVHYLEGCHQRRFGRGEEIDDKKMQIEEALQLKRKTEYPEVKIPIQYKITTSQGEDIVWSGIGKVPSDLKEELQRQGKELNDCKID